MTITEIEEHVKMMRRVGLAILEIGDTKMILGPEPEEDIEPMKPDEQPYEEYSSHQIFGD